MAAVPRRRPPVILELDLAQPPTSGEAASPLARVRSRGRRRLEPTLRALHEAGDDPRVVGLVARVGGRLPWALMQELRLGVRAFAASGKPTLAWSEYLGDSAGGMAGYVLASAFDEVWLQPGSALSLPGVAVEATFLRGALDKLGVEPQLEQRHEYKNAADTLMRTEFTDAHRAALDRIAESVFGGAVAAIAQGRRMEAARVRELVDAGPWTAAEARDAGLVDTLGYRDQAHAAIRERVGGEADLLFADRWRPRRRRRLPGRDHVAVVEISGAIASGRSRRGPLGRTAGSDTVASALEAARRDDRARAVVLHVDSPGGSAVASESIWREVCRVREAGKPVVVTMGQVAASGGYYVACAADVVLALPATLTGSIGVVGGKVVVAELLERWGLSTGTVSYGARSLMYSARRGFSEGERARLAAQLDAIYDGFVAKVAQGRGRPVADVEAVARGRVWTGGDALEVGLVDRLGGRVEALRVARERAGLPEDAPARTARPSPLARLGHPRSSEDPRSAGPAGLADSLGGALRAGSPLLASLLAGRGLADAGSSSDRGPSLRMPPVTLR